MVALHELLYFKQCWMLNVDYRYSRQVTRAGGRQDTRCTSDRKRSVYRHIALSSVRSPLWSTRRRCSRTLKNKTEVQGRSLKGFQIYFLYLANFSSRFFIKCLLKYSVGRQHSFQSIKFFRKYNSFFLRSVVEETRQVYTYACIRCFRWLSSADPRSRPRSGRISVRLRRAYIGTAWYPGCTSVRTIRGGCSDICLLRKDKMAFSVQQQKNI